MSFQRPTTASPGPSSASYSEFLKDIYFSMRTLTTGLGNVNQRLDGLATQLASFDTQLTNQGQILRELTDKVDILNKCHENTMNLNTSTGANILSELDTLGLRQIEPSNELLELGTLNSQTMKIKQPKILWPPNFTPSDTKSIHSLNLPNELNDSYESLDRYEAKEPHNYNRCDDNSTSSSSSNSDRTNGSNSDSTNDSNSVTTINSKQTFMILD